MKKGMVLEGGAMRGLYTAGVLDVLMEKEIVVDGYIGVSAGISMGCNYRSAQKGRVLRYIKKYVRDPRFSGVRSFIKTGDIFGSDFCYHEIPEKLDPFDYNTFYSSPIELYTVITDAKTGEAVYCTFPDRWEKDIEVMRASSSMPGVSKPVTLDGKEYFDGSVSDSIPIEFLMEKGYDRILVVLTRPRGYRKEVKPLGKTMKFLLRKYPAMITALERRNVEYNRELDLLDKLEKEGKVVIIAPTEDLKVKRIEKDVEKIENLYNLGRKNTEEKLDEIKALFEIGL